MNTHNLLLVLLCVSLFFSCKEKKSNTLIVVKNTMNVDRSLETVCVDLTLLKINDLEQGIAILDTDTKEKVISQQVDSDGDGQLDALLFQPKIGANSKKTYKIIVEKFKERDSVPSCYSRFVPERTDDYAWENNRVAFRTFGPTAQKMIEDGIKGGTLSSGIDAWLKRVDYPIINSWYKKELETNGSYHEDTGEGLDNFHVGISRGVGGIAKKIDTLYYTSKNFSSWKTLANGPIRTSFILTYDDWDAAGNIISEEKKILLDYGSNLSKFEIILKGTDTISAGLTLHENEGQIGINQDENWLSYWENHDDSELGSGIVVPLNTMVGYDIYTTSKKDESNLFAQIKTNNNKVVYYAGFGWKKSNQFNNQNEWENYLSDFSKKLNDPLVVVVK